MSEQLTTQTETPRGRGAPPGNANRTRHGLRSSGLPPGCGWIEGQLRAFRRYLHEEIASRNDGEVGLYPAALIQSATRHESRCLLASRWLRKEAATLTPDQRVNLLREIGAGTTARDRCLREMGLHQSEVKDALSSLYGDVGPLAPDQWDEPPGTGDDDGKRP